MTAVAAHEIVDAFERTGRPLHNTLREMLEEHPGHRTERRGCGYTQATRFLSTFVNRTRDPESTFDLGIFDDWPKQRTEHLARNLIAAGWTQGWRRADLAGEDALSRIPRSALLDEIVALPNRLASIQSTLRDEENAVLMLIVRAILAPEPTYAPAIPAMPEKPEIGSCSQAEEFFLEIAHGRVRRGGRVNIFVDAAGRPTLIEKMALGESHSAMAVAPVSINGVGLPPGALFALRYDDDSPRLREVSCGASMPLSAIDQARFLRLTTLAVPPAIRRRAFSAQFEAQIRAGMLSPETTTIDHLRAFAESRLAES